MITLPPQFTATKYPGYFWNTETRTLYSIKITGELREIQKIHPNSFNFIRESGYRISHKGHRKFMPMSYLMELPIKDSEILMRIK